MPQLRVPLTGTGTDDDPYRPDLHTTVAGTKHGLICNPSGVNSQLTNFALLGTVQQAL